MMRRGNLPARHGHPLCAQGGAFPRDTIALLKKRCNSCGLNGGNASRRWVEPTPACHAYLELRGPIPPSARHPFTEPLV